MKFVILSPETRAAIISFWMYQRGTSPTAEVDRAFLERTLAQPQKLTKVSQWVAELLAHEGLAQI